MDAPHPPTQAGDVVDGLDELAGRWAARLVDFAITVGAAAYCAWMLDRCFAELLDVARGWKASTLHLRQWHEDRTAAERSQEPQGGPVEDGPG